MVETELQFRRKVPYQPITKSPTLTPVEIARKESVKEGWFLLLRGFIGFMSFVDLTNSLFRINAI